MIKLSNIISGDFEIKGFEDKVLTPLFFINVSPNEEEFKDVLDLDGLIVDGHKLIPSKAIITDVKTKEETTRFDKDVLLIQVDPESLADANATIIDPERQVLVIAEVGDKYPVGIPYQVEVIDNKLIGVKYMSLLDTSVDAEVAMPPIDTFCRYLYNVGFRDDYISKYVKIIYNPNSIASIACLNIISLFTSKPLQELNIIAYDKDVDYTISDDDVVLAIGLPALIKDALNMTSSATILVHDLNATYESIVKNSIGEIPLVINYLVEIAEKALLEFSEDAYALELLLKEEKGHLKLIESFQSLLYGKIPPTEISSYYDMMKVLNRDNVEKAKKIADNIEQLVEIAHIRADAIGRVPSVITTTFESDDALAIVYDSIELIIDESTTTINIVSKEEQLAIDIFKRASTDVTYSLEKEMNEMRDSIYNGTLFNSVVTEVIKNVGIVEIMNVDTYIHISISVPIDSVVLSEN